MHAIVENIYVYVCVGGTFVSILLLSHLCIQTFGEGSYVSISLVKPVMSPDFCWELMCPCFCWKSNEFTKVPAYKLGSTNQVDSKTYLVLGLGIGVVGVADRLASQSGAVHSLAKEQHKFICERMEK